MDDPNDSLKLDYRTARLASDPPATPEEQKQLGLRCAYGLILACAIIPIALFFYCVVMKINF